MDPQELVPLEAGLAQVHVKGRQTKRQSYALHNRDCCRGPIRLCRLLLLVIVVPSLFVLVPLYLRYRVYSGQMYPMSMTDMRLIDSKISPTWCQRQVVRSNATFNAFVVPEQPKLTDELVPVSMTRELELEDDMKEYWGFYLLRGSSVTVSSCVRWPGASLIMIKGYKHLQNCAYIGDDSSEELDELLDAHALGLLSNDTLLEKLQQLKKEDGKANHPETMKRHKAGVSFHNPNLKANVTSQDPIPAADVTDHDPKELKEILERLHALRQAQKNEALKNYHIPNHLMPLPALHRHRDTNVDRDERRWLTFKDIDGPKEYNDSSIIDIYQNRRKVTTDKRNNNKGKTLAINTPVVSISEADKVKDVVITTIAENDEEIVVTEQSNVKVVQDANETVVTPTSYVQTQTILKEDTDMTSKNKNSTQDPIPGPDEANSREVFEDVLTRLKALGDRGKRVLIRLHETMGIPYQEEKSNKRVMSAVSGSEEELDHLRQVLLEAIDEEKTRTQREQKRRDARFDARAKRELMLGAEDFRRELNEDDEPRNLAAEEDLDPDGYAEHHEQLNETTAFDMSNSEFWSSFSSSEEALLECDGLILNLPLIPHASCHEDASSKDTMNAARANALTYRVPANGYYFFVFNSENEVQKNYIRAKFDLQKTRYDIARTTLRECRNKTDRCDLSLDIFTSQKVVLEVPLRDNESLWNEQFVIISECEPRTSIYLFCVITVPVLILVFAFQ